MKLLLRKLLPVVLGLAVLGLLVWAFLPSPVDVDLGRVGRGPLLVTVDHEGKTRVKERYVVSAPLSGLLLRVEHKPGKRVEAGETLLATLEPVDPAILDARARTQAEKQVESAKAAKKQAESNMARARGLHAQAQRDLERARRLIGSRTIPEADYESAIFREHTAAAELKAAEFALQIADFELEQAKAALIHTRPRSPGEDEPFRFFIRAPIHGQVLRVFQESATVVMPGTRLLEVGDPTDLECEIDVLSSDAVKIKEGAKVMLEHWGGDYPLQGWVRVREPSGFTKISALGVEEQRVNIIVDFIDPPEKRPTLGDAYRVEARVVIWEGHDVLKVPAGALFRRGDGWAVFRVEGGRAVVRPVQVGHSNGLETEVLDGLSENDMVILHPSDRIKDGVAIVPR